MALNAPDKKRKKAVASPSYNATLFHSKEHEERYNDFVKVRSIQNEKVIQVGKAECPEMVEQILSRRWNTLVSFPRPVSQLLIKEFYANAFLTGPAKRNQYVSFVRRKEIRYNASIINSILRTSVPKECEYEQLLDQDVDTNALLTALCRLGASWIYTKKGEPRKLKALHFKPIPRAWCTIVHHTLQVCANVSDVIVSRAQLVYCIVKGKKIDEGEILVQDIYEIAQASRAALGHASLIAMLCENAGMEVSNEEILVRPMLPVTWIYIQRFEQGPIGQQAGHRNAPQQQGQSQGQQSQTVILDRLGHVETGLTEVTEQLSHVALRQGRLDRNVQAMCRLNTLILQSQQGLESMMCRMAENQGINGETVGCLPVGPLSEQQILEIINFDDFAGDDIEEGALGDEETAADPNQGEEEDAP